MVNNNYFTKQKPHYKNNKTNHNYVKSIYVKHILGFRISYQEPDTNIHNQFIDLNGSKIFSKIDLQRDMTKSQL